MNDRLKKNMTEKEKADCLIALHKEQSSRFLQTRDIEFKINLALWGFIILAGYFVLNNVLPKIQEHFVLFEIGYVIVSSLIISSHYLFWMFPIARSEEINDFFIRKYSFKIEELSGSTIQPDPGDIPIIKKFGDFGERSKHWIKIEVGITASLLIIIFVFGLFVRT
jgi:hypothetical protein